MRVGSGHHVGSGHMEASVDSEGRLVQGVLTVEDLARVVDQQQVRYSDVAERHSKGVYPEGVIVLRVPDGDVTGYSLAEPEFSKDSKSCCQPFLPVSALFSHVREVRDLVRDGLVGPEGRVVAGFGLAHVGLLDGDAQDLPQV